MNNVMRGLILPVLHAHFQRPEMRQKLCSLAGWDHSFEKWFQWEAALAIQKKWQRAFGRSLTEEDYTRWDVEVKRGRKRVDLVLPLPGGSDVLLELKVYVPFFFPTNKWVIDPDDSILRDIRWVYRIKSTTAAVIALVLETKAHKLHWHRHGLSAPVRHAPPIIELGTTWCAGVNESCNVSARLYCWMNGVRAPTALWP